MNNAWRISPHLTPTKPNQTYHPQQHHQQGVLTPSNPPQVITMQHSCYGRACPGGNKGDEEIGGNALIDLPLLGMDLGNYGGGILRLAKMKYEIYRVRANATLPLPFTNPFQYPPIARLHISPLEDPKSAPRLPTRSPDVCIPISSSHTIATNISRIRAGLVAPPPGTANTSIASVRVLLGFACAEAGEEDDEHAEKEEKHGGEDCPHSHGIVGVRARVVSVDVVSDGLWSWLGVVCWRGERGEGKERNGRGGKR